MTIIGIHSSVSRRSLLWFTGTGAVAALLPTASRADSTVSCGYASPDASNTPHYVAVAKGFFKAEGLDVTLIDSQSGTRGRQMLAAQQIGFANSGAGDPLVVTVAGKTAVLVAGVGRRFDAANILVHRDNLESGRFHKIADLAGETIGCSQLKSATWLMAVYLTERAGVGDKVTVRGLGDALTMMASVKSKQVAATIATMGMIESARKEGWGDALFSIADDATWNTMFGGDVVSIGTYVMADSIEPRHQEIQKFVNAIAKATDFINTNPPEVIADAIHKDYLSGFPLESIVRTLGLYKRIFFSADNLIAKAAYDRFLDVMRGRLLTGQEAASVPYEKCVDMSFVEHARSKKT